MLAPDFFTKTITSGTTPNTRDWALQQVNNLQGGAINTQFKALSAFTGTGATNVNLFTVVNSVDIEWIYGFVNTTIGNMTAAHLNLYDGTDTAQITDSVAPATLTGVVAGSVLFMVGDNTTPLTVLNAATAAVYFPTLPIVTCNVPFKAAQKTGSVNTYIRLSYSTTDNPPAGAITWYVGYRSQILNAKINAA